MVVANKVLVTLHTIGVEFSTMPTMLFPLPIDSNGALNPYDARRSRRREIPSGAI